MKLVQLLAALATTLGLVAPASGDFTVSGAFRYRDRLFTYSGGFVTTEPSLPVRFAHVEVADNSTGQLLATGSTRQDGGISIVVPGTGARDVVVRCISRSIDIPKQVRVSAPGGALYSVSSTVFPSWNQSTDLDIGTIVSEKIFSGSAQASPFNLLDQGVAAMEYVLALGASPLTDDISLRWPGGPTSFAIDVDVTIGDGDGYDDFVILHELGHAVQSMWSDSDSPGGAHFLGDSDQDPRLSYGEGWATFFGSAVRESQTWFDPGFYMDLDGNGGTGPGSILLRYRLETAAPFAATTGGEATEVGVSCVLWDIVDTAATADGNGVDDDPLDGSISFAGGIDGDRVNWRVFTGPVAAANDLTIRDHWNGFFAPVDYGNYLALRDVFGAFGIRNYLDPEEPNNTLASATPYVDAGGFTSTKSIYYSPASPPSPGDLDSDFWAFDMAAGETFTVETRYPDGNVNAHTYADPFLRVFRPNGTLFASDNNGGPGRNARVSGTANVSGTWKAEVTTLHAYRRTGSYQVRIVRSGSGISSIVPSAVKAASLAPQLITLVGYGLTNALALSIDGVPLVLGTDFLVDSDTSITARVPLLTKTGSVDVIVTTPNAVGTAKLVVEPVSSPLLKAPSAALQFQGIDLLAAAGIFDWTWVIVSAIDAPTVVPGLFALDIGGQGASYVVPWRPFIPAAGYVKKHIGPISGLAGVTVYWQSLVFELSNGFNPPWASSNKQTTVIVF
jgi:hypothetical protein